MTAQPTHEAHVTTASIDLLSGALRSLETAITSQRAGERYVAAHLAALRAAAALLAAHARPNTRKPTSAWVLVSKVVPDFAEWAAFFASCAGKRAAAEAGLGGAVTPREADDMVRDANEFIVLVADRLGVSRQLVFPRLDKDASNEDSASSANNVIPLRRIKRV
jgi:hypothetical protein